MALLLLKIVVYFLIRLVDTNFVKIQKKNKNNKKNRFKMRKKELGKIEDMMKNELNTKKGQKGLKVGEGKGVSKYLKKLNDFLCVEFFCNFFMAI